MADNVSSELLLEHMKALRGESSRTNDRLDRIERRLGTMDDHIAALVKSEGGNERDFAMLERRVARIEERLNLREADG